MPAKIRATSLYIVFQGIIFFPHRTHCSTLWRSPHFIRLHPRIEVEHSEHTSSRCLRKWIQIMVVKTAITIPINRETMVDSLLPTKGIPAVKNSVAKTPPKTAQNNAKCQLQPLLTIRVPQEGHGPAIIGTFTSFLHRTQGSNSSCESSFALR